MVPPGYTVYFTAVTGSAAALVGLLFVSVSLRPDTVFGPDTNQGRVLANSAFTGLVNAFFISLLALLPGENLGGGAIVLAALSLAVTVRRHRQLGKSKTQLLLLLLSVIAYLCQLGAGAALVASPHDKGAVEMLADILMGALGIALGRAWALLQGKHIEKPGNGTAVEGPVGAPSPADITA